MKEYNSFHEALHNAAAAYAVDLQCGGCCDAQLYATHFISTRVSDKALSYQVAITVLATEPVGRWLAQKEQFTIKGHPEVWQITCKNSVRTLQKGKRRPNEIYRIVRAYREVGNLNAGGVEYMKLWNILEGLPEESLRLF